MTYKWLKLVHCQVMTRSQAEILNHRMKPPANHQHQRVEIQQAFSQPNLNVQQVMVEAQCSLTRVEDLFPLPDSHRQNPSYT